METKFLRPETIAKLQDQRKQQIIQVEYDSFKPRIEGLSYDIAGLSQSIDKLIGRVEDLEYQFNRRNEVMGARMLTHSRELNWLWASAAFLAAAITALSVISWLY